MTREEIYTQCVEKIDKTNCLLLEAATGMGKSKISIDLVNYIIKRDKIKVPKILILVAKRVHKQTWRDEIEKWGGMGNALIRMECYESLHKCSENWDIILLDEVHHVGSPTRMEILSKISYKYMIGLSATIPRKVKQYFRYRYHSELVSCNIIEAIEDDVLPEPEILLFPLLLDNRNPTETWEINGKVKGYVVYGSIKDIWKYKREKTHAILSCTQRQKLLEFDRLIEWEKNKYMMSRNPALERSWLYHAGKRLEFLAYCKNQIVSDILKKLSKERTITFCKTIEQCEELGKNCIHSKNGKSDEVYEKFNEKKIKHITAVNILNENANLVDCKYAIFANISSSDIVIPQRLGRSMRHKHPVIIFPYYKDTREEEIITKMLKDFNKDFIRTINSIEEI
jgi:superfamily II DNA or RNA helicase